MKMMARRTVVAIVLIAGASIGNAQTVRRICPAGCQYLPTQLQQAVNDAQPGDIITIDPVSGATAVSGLTLPIKGNPNGQYITMRSANIYNLPDKVRVSPSDPNLAVVTTTPNYPVLTAKQGAGFYRFEGIQFMNVRGNPITNLIQFGTIVEGRLFDNQVSQLAHDIEFDRCVFGGWAGFPGPYRGIMANMGRLSVTNSYFTEIKGVNSEAQAIAEWSGQGPFFIRNNAIEASTMETLFGGAIPNIQGIRPKDLQFVGNEYRKRWSWKFTRGTAVPTGACMSDELGGEWWADQSANGGVWTCVSGAWSQSDEATFQTEIFEDPANFKSGTTDPIGACSGTTTYKNTSAPSYWRCSSGTWLPISLGPFAATAGDSYWEKNHWELKNAERVIAEGNYLHRSWAPGSQSQHGACVLLNQVDNANGKTPPFGEPSAVIANVRFANNWCDQTPWGVSNGVLNPTGYFQQIHDVSVSNNLFTNLGNAPFSGSDAQFIQSGNTGKYAILHNTVISQAANYGVLSDMNGPMYPSQEIAFSGNVVSWMHSGFYSEVGAAGNLNNAIDAVWALNRSFSKNVIVNSQQVGSGSIASNIFSKSVTPKYSGLIPCVSCAVAGCYDNGGTGDVGFVNLAGGDYHLKPSSPYAGWWAHASPAGADIDQVLWSTAGAKTGQWNPFLDFRIRGIAATQTSAMLVYTAYDTTSCTVTVSTRPDLFTPVFLAQDSRNGDLDGTLEITGLATGTRYFYLMNCAGFTRNGQFLTN